MFRIITLAFFAVALSSPVFGATAAVDGIDVYWKSEGEGPAIVFVHGMTHDATAWAGQVDAFKDDYQVVALDLPGHGMSGLSEDGEYTMDLFASAIEAVRVAADLNEMVLVGHSMGGRVVGKYALNFPDRVAGLVAVDAYFNQEPRAPRSSEVEREVPREQTTNTDPREQFFRDMFVDSTPESVQNEVLGIVLSVPLDVAGAIARSMSTFGSVESKTIDVPASVIVAGSVPDLEVERIWNLVPRAKIEKVPGTGHFLMMEKPQEFNARLREFLEGIDF